MPCSCQKNRDQFEVVREGGLGKVVFRSGVKSTAVTVSGRYGDSIVRNDKTGEVVFAGKDGALELTAANGSVLLRTDDAQLIARVAAANEGSTARNTTTGEPVDVAPAPAAAEAL